MWQGNGLIGDGAHSYVFSWIPEVGTYNVVIICTLLVCDHMASVLFDTRSTFSYISSLFAVGLDLHCYLLICVSTSVSESVIVEKVLPYDIFLR